MKKPHAPPGKNQPPPNWQDGFKSALPNRETLAAHPWLKPVANRVLDPVLWRWQHEAVARGAAIGMLWAFSIPFGQVLFAAAHCVFWRANIPVAAGVTLITNPFTLTFWLWLAYQVGATLLGADAAAPTASPSDAGLLALLSNYGAPTVLGMGIFGVGGAALAYFGVKLAWRLRVWVKRRHR